VRCGEVRWGLAGNIMNDIVIQVGFCDDGCIRYEIVRNDDEGMVMDTLGVYKTLEEAEQGYKLISMKQDHD